MRCILPEDVEDSMTVSKSHPGREKRGDGSVDKCGRETDKDHNGIRM